MLLAFTHCLFGDILPSLQKDSFTTYRYVMIDYLRRFYLLHPFKLFKLRKFVKANGFKQLKPQKSLITLSKEMHF